MLNRKLTSLLLLLFIFIQPLTYISVLSARGSSSFELTTQEKEYLHSISGKSLKLAITSELMSFETKNGGFGLLRPLTDFMEKEWDLKIDIENCGWGNAFRKLDNGEVDLVGLAILSDGRKEKYFATEPLYTSSMDIYTRVSDPLINITNLDNSTIGLVSGSVLTDLLQQYIRVNTTVKNYDTIDELFTALSNNEVDCVISALNAQSELLKYPNITRESDVETVLPSQGLYAKAKRMEPLIKLINRYLQSAYGSKLLENISKARENSVLEKARQFYADDIEYLKTYHSGITIYDSGVLYPFHFEKNSNYEGIQEDVNRMFQRLTGKEITVLPASDFSQGFLTALEKIKSGEIVGAEGIYYNKEYDLDPDYSYSNPVYRDKLGFYATKELDSIHGLRIATTPFAAPYVDWQTITGREPVIYGDRGAMLQALREGAIDAVFVSEMSVDYNYSILGDHSFVRAVPFEADANIHMIAGSKHKVFVKLFNASVILDKMLNPENYSKWMDASRNDKYELIRVRNQLSIYEKAFIIAAAFIILVLAALLFIINRNYRKFSNYDRQISQMLSTQKNADMLWGNKKTRRIISKGGFPLFKKWGMEVPEYIDSDEFYKAFGGDINIRGKESKPYCETETSFTVPMDNSKHTIRHYTHKINDNEFMVFALDVTDEKIREENLSQLANTDSLSSLLTRRAMAKELQSRIAASMNSKETLYALMIDIDDFKKVNDNYGHDIGDETLISTANTIKNNISDGLASRWGGEEFLVVVSCLGEDEVMELADNMRKAISENIIGVAQRLSFSVTVSCGVAPINGNDYEKAITHADEALYTAKKEGKNCVRYME